MPFQKLRTPFLLVVVFAAIALGYWFVLKPAAPPKPTKQVKTEDSTPSAQLTVEVSTTSGNLFSNPGFESGSAPWFSSDTWSTAFSLNQKIVHSGKNSALLEFDSDKTKNMTEVHGVIQEMSLKTFPEKISGYYYVENWQPGTRNQYLQFAVIVFDAKNIPSDVATYKNHQIRFLLSGIDHNPFDIANGKFIFLSKNQPVKGKWIYFERNLKEDFLKQWGSVPEGFSKIRFFFETRWDARLPSDGHSVAKVYYDDLYLGSDKEKP